MRLLENLRLRTRLGATFSLLAVGLAAIAAAGVMGIGDSSERTATITDRDLRISNTFGEIILNGELSSHLLSNVIHVVPGNAEQQKPLAAQAEQMSATVIKLSESMGPLVEGTKADGPYKTYLPFMEKWRAAMLKGIERAQYETANGLPHTESQRIYREEFVPAWQACGQNASAVIKATREMAAAEIAAQKASAASATRTILLVAGIVLVLVAGLAFVITRGITRPIASIGARLRSLNDRDIAGLTGGIENVARGDLTRRVDTHTEPVEATAKDEVGELGQTFNAMLANTHRSIEAYNRMCGQLGGLVEQVSTSASTVSATSQQMATTSDEAGRAVGEVAHAVGDVAQGAERQVQMVERARASAEEAAQAAAMSAAGAQETAERALAAREAASDGVRAAGEATEAIRQVASSSAEVATTIEALSERSERIGGIVDTITGIAGQTNLLALNAAIEAARAGEQGRGFAVVAEEVRKLAEESQKAAGEIAGLIEEIQGETQKAVAVVGESAQRTEDGVATVEQTREAFEHIGSAVDDVTARIAEIAGAAQQLSAVSEQMRVSIDEVAAVAEQSSASAEQVSASTQQTSASTQEIASSAAELASTAAQLEELVDRFTVSR